MKLLTTTQDEKIKSKNHLIEMSIGEYTPIAKEIINNNDLQRRRINPSNKTYSLLKDDIKTGCVIPPLVLAIFPKDNENGIIYDESNIIQKIKEAGKDLLILDGLQRSFTIIDLLDELKINNEALLKVKNSILRIEVYTSISKVGVLYRMLTLNTGQNPMSTRHQVEMIYSDYKSGFDDLTFITESEDRVPTGDNEFRFGDIIDGFLSYITGDYFPIVREDLVSIIKNLETLTKDDKQKDVFKLLITAYNNLRKRITEISENWTFDKESIKLIKRPFAYNVNEIFSKVQMIAGFGAAVSFLIENKLIKDIEELISLIAQIKTANIADSLNILIGYLDEIQVNAKKIGNEQRMYFYYLIRNIFNKSSEGYLEFDLSVPKAYQFYKANLL